MWVAVINLMYGRKCVLIRGLSSYLPCHRLRCSDDLSNKPISNDEVNFIAEKETWGVILLFVFSTIM